MKKYIPIREEYERASREKKVRVEKLRGEIEQEIIGDTMLNKNAQAEVMRYKKYKGKAEEEVSEIKVLRIERSCRGISQGQILM